MTAYIPSFPAMLQSFNVWLHFHGSSSIYIISELTRMGEVVQATYKVPDCPGASKQAPHPEQLSRRPTAQPGSTRLMFFLVKSLLKTGEKPWPGSSVGQSVALIHQGCGFRLRSGHIQATNKCISMCNNKSMFLSLSLSKKNNNQ